MGKKLRRVIGASAVAVVVVVGVVILVATLLQNGGFEDHSNQVTVDNDNLVFSPGRAIVQLSASSPTTDWNVTNFNGTLVAHGTETVVDGAASINLSVLPVGYYALGIQGGTNSIETSLAVIDGLDDFPDVASNPFGIAAHPELALDVDLQETLVELGIGSLRFDMRWSQIEPTAGQYTFTPNADYDQVIAALTAQGIRPLLILGYANPLYDGGDRPSTTEGRAAYAAYAKEIAQRYGNAVDYEVYNEYNHPGGYNLGTCGAGLSCYNEMLRVTARAIRSIVPDATIAMTGMAGLTNWWLGGSTSDTNGNHLSYNWLNAFLQSDGLQYVDVINIHNYGFPAPPEGQNDAVVHAVRELMSRYPAAAGKKLWMTEAGWSTTSIASVGVTEQQQAPYLVRDAVLSLSEGLDRYMVYDLLDDWVDDNLEGRFGIMRNSITNPALAPKPAFVTYSVLNHQLADHQFDRRDDLGSGIYSVVFSDGSGDEKRVMWATSPATIAVSSTQTVHTVGAYGDTALITPYAGSAIVRLTNDPVYVSGSGITGVVLGTNTALYRGRATDGAAPLGSLHARFPQHHLGHGRSDPARPALAPSA